MRKEYRMSTACTLKFDLPDGTVAEVAVTTLLNGGYAGRSQDDVAAHVRELAELGVPAPSVTPSLYPVSPYLAQQTSTVPAQHGKTSGEAEWALVVPNDFETGSDVLLTVACDHTDRALEVHGVAWSKNAGPDVLGSKAWRLSDVADRIDEIELTAWADGVEIQRGTLAELLTPQYWVERLRELDLLKPGTVLLSGTIPMHHGVDQFASKWRVELRDPATGDVIDCDYEVTRLPEPIG
jgi:2-keto-4-pentenoate hydratase/2-oxohepta-3-ene-1,7-dioic acid hydratase in catechol pathway